MQSGRRRTPDRSARRLRGSSRERPAEKGQFEVTWSVVALGFMLGAVSMLALAEFEKRPQPFECPSNIEVKALVTSVGQHQYLDDLLKAGLDRVDIIADSHYSDVADIGMKPYHWAVLKAEALRTRLRKRVSIASLLRGEDLTARSAQSAQGGKLPTPPPEHEASEDFFNIPPNQFIPANFEKVTITTVLTGSLQERLGGIFNSAVLGKALSARLHLIWVVNKACGVKFSSVLSVSERMSFSTVQGDAELGNIFHSKTVLEDFTGVFTTEGTAVNKLMDADVALKGPTSLWWERNAKNVSVTAGGPIANWVKERIGLGLKTHLLYGVGTLAPGVTMEAVKEAVEHYAIHPSKEVLDLVKRVSETNDITEHNTLAVYDVDVPSVRPNDIFGRKMYLMTTPALPPVNTSSPTVHSPYNASHPHNTDTTDFYLFSSSVLLTAYNIPTHTAGGEGAAIPPGRAEMLLSSVLCPAGIICPKSIEK